MQKYLYSAAFIFSVSNCLAMDDDPYHNSRDMTARKTKKFITEMLRKHAYNIPNKQITAPKVTADESADLINKSDKN